MQIDWNTDAAFRAWEAEILRFRRCVCAGPRTGESRSIHLLKMPWHAVRFLWVAMVMLPIVLTAMLVAFVTRHQRSWMGPLTSLRAFAWSHLLLAGYNLLFVAFCREGAVAEETLGVYSWTAYALIAASMGTFLLDALNCQKTEIFDAISRTLTSLRQDLLTVGAFLCRVFAEIVRDTDARLVSLFQSRHDSVGTFEYALLPWQEVSIKSLRVAPRSEIE